MRGQRGRFYHGLIPPLPSGSGFGFVLGPVQNAFAGASRSAAENARDTYQAAHHEWRSRYATNFPYRPRFAIRLEFAGQVVYQTLAGVGRDGDTLTWEDVAALAVVQGPAGPKGDPGAGADRVTLAALMDAVLRSRDDITITYDAAGNTVTIGRRQGSTDHVRRVGWSETANPTTAEILAGASSMTNRLVIPQVPAQLMADGAHLWFWIEGSGVMLERIQIGAFSILQEFARSSFVLQGTSGTLYASMSRLSSRMSGSTALLS